MAKHRGYTVDSTRGKSMIDPKSYKADVYCQSWLNSRMLATLSVWLDNNGLVTRHLSDVVRLTMDQVLRHIVDNGSVQLIEDTKEARELLEMKYRVNLNPNNRGEKNLIHNMTLDERRREYSRDANQAIQPIGEQSNRMRRPSENEIREALKIVDDEAREVQRLKDKERIAMMKKDANGLIIADQPRHDISEDKQIKFKIPNWSDYKTVYNNKTEIPKGVDQSTPRKLTDEELDERDRLRKEKDRLEKEEMDKMLVR